MMRSIAQALGASIASIAVPVLACLYILSGDPVLNSDGTIDDAPERSAMLILVFSPLLIPILAAYFASVPIALRKVSYLSLQNLLFVDLLAATIAAVAFGLQGYFAFGLADGAISFAVFLVLPFLNLGLGSFVWSRLRPPPAA